MDNREAFEQWANKNNHDTTRTDTPISTRYKSPITQELFRAWQAAVKWQKEQPVEALPFLNELQRKVLRDKFAMAAKQGMLAHPTRYKPRPQDQHLHWHQALAKEAYEIADAMLKEREK